MRIETSANSLENTAVSIQRGAKPGALSPDLQEIILAWPDLPATVEAGIVEMVRAGISRSGQ
jgi:hypothetical protein